MASFNGQMSENCSECVTDNIDWKFAEPLTRHHNTSLRPPIPYSAYACVHGSSTTFILHQIRVPFPSSMGRIQSRIALRCKSLESKNRSSTLCGALEVVSGPVDSVTCKVTSAAAPSRREGECAALPSRAPPCSPSGPSRAPSPSPAPSITSGVELNAH